MTLKQIIGLNVKWYRYQNHLTQEQYANKIKFKVAYVSENNCTYVVKFFYY